MSRLIMLVVFGFVWSVSPLSHASKNDKIQKKRAKSIRFCLHPKMYKTSPFGFYGKLKKSFRGMAPRRYTNALAKSVLRLWRMSKGGGKKSSSRSFRRKIRKAIRKVKKKANKPFCFSHPRKILVYGLMRLKNRSLINIEQHCIDHDTFRVFKFVPGSFLIPLAKNKPCEGVMYTELRRKIAFSELYSPVLTPFRRMAFNVGGQRVDVFVWKNANKKIADRVGKHPEFRFRILMLRKKWKDTPALRKKRNVLLKKNKALIDREVLLMKKKMKDLKMVLGGYVLMYPHNGKPAYFGHFQMASFNGFFQRVLNTSVGRWVLTSATHSNMAHIARP